MNKILWLLLGLALCLGACREDQFTEEMTETDPPVVQETYVKTLYGRVVSTDGAALADVEVRVGNLSIYTDEYGTFILPEVAVPGRSGVYIRAQAYDYFAGGQRLRTSNTDNQYIELELIKKASPASLRSDQGGNVAINGGGSIDFPASSLMTIAGTPYEGLAEIATHYLDPSEADFLDRAPGDLTAINNDGNIAGLQSLGMIAVEMIAPDGTPLQVRDGSTVSITVPVPSALMGAAPATIPLWHFDESAGYWLQEGEATLSGESYVGEVSHFSWWNCDIEIEPINLCVDVNQPIRAASLSGVKIQLCDDILGSASGYTDQNGTLCGIVPRDRVITVKVLDGCDEVLFMQDVGPFSDDATISIEVFIPSDLEYRFTGTVTECSTTTGVADALVGISTEFDYQLLTTDADGNYDTYLILCSNTTDYSVSAISGNLGLAGYATGVAALNDNNVLDVELCNDQPFITIVDNNGTVVFTNTDVSVKARPNETIVIFDAGSYIAFAGNTTGTFPMNAAFQNTLATKAMSTVTITSFGAAGNSVSGNFQGINENNGEAFTGQFVGTRTE